MIPHNKPTVQNDDIKAVNDVLAAALLSQGAKVEEFETAFSKMHNGYHAVAVNSGTSALHLALLALKIGKGDEVIIPSYVCAALLNAVNYVGATPRLADIGCDDFNISPIEVKKKINKKTKAVIVPHLFGLPARMNEFKNLGIYVIEDCAQSVGAKIDEKITGTFGDISIFSFYSTKVMTTSGEGGMVLTSSSKLNSAIEDLRDYDEKAFYRVRYNYKMTDVAAAMGLTQLKKLDRFIDARRGTAKYYNDRLNGRDIFIERENGGSNIYFRYLVKIDKDQNKFVKAARDSMVSVKRPVYFPLHRHLNLRDSDFPVSTKAWKTVFSVPIYPSILKKEVVQTADFLVNY